MIDHQLNQKIENAKTGFASIQKSILKESKECNPRIVVTAEAFGHQTEILRNLLIDKEEK